MSNSTLGGYRIVRKLGEGARAEVYLGYPDRDDSPAPAGAIKVYRPGVGHDSVIAEVEALSRATGQHVVRVIDLCSTPEGLPAVVLERLAGDNLARLLARRARLSLGEAVTILAPIAETLGRMHAAGVTHGAVRAEAILFTEAGAPVIACFGSARLCAPGMARASLDSHPAVAADRASLATIVAVVLGHVHEPAASRIAAWAANSPERLIHDLGPTLFENAESEPIDFAERPPVAVSVPQRLVAPGELGESYALGLIERARGFVAGVRPVIAGAVAAALVAAVLLVPVGDSDAAPDVPGSESSGSEAPGALPSASAAVPDVAVTADDPVPALLALLETRERCIRELSLLCLDAVGQSGSAALALDQQLVRELQAGAESPEAWGIASATLTERLGDSALVTINDPAESEPASVLLMKGEAGWRIRDYLWR